MKNFLIAISLILLSFSTIAEEEQKALPPLDPAYVGAHPMVLMSHSSTIYAYPFPSYSKPRDAQILYKLEVKNVALVQLVRDNALVTVVPEEFNLQRLMRGEKLSLKADIYMGHYKEGGMKVYEGMTLNLAKQLYYRDLKGIVPSGRMQTYDVVPLNKSNKIYIHKLQQAPSFDHILHIDEVSSCAKLFPTSSAVPKESELQYKFINCGTMKPLYFNTQGIQ